MFGAKDILPEREIVDGMQYTLSTLKESLRKYTVVPVVTRRVGIEEDELCGHRVPKGTMIVLSLQVQCESAFDATLILFIFACTTSLCMMEDGHFAAVHSSISQRP